MYIHPTTGRIGMGTLAPDTRLHLDGDENNGSTATLKITGGGESMLFDGNEIDVAGNQALYLNFNSSGNVLIGAGGGRVGIGTSGPASPFHVYGGASGVVPNAQSKYFFEDNSNHYILMASPDAIETGISFAKPGSGANILHSVGGGLSFRTNSNPRMTLTNAGDMGVGVTTPDSKFHVSDGSAGAVTALAGTVGTFESNTNTYLSVLSPTGALGGLVFGSPTGTLRGSVLYNHGSDLMTIATAGSNRLAIDGTGNVGVGTTSPDTKLHVEGTAESNGVTGVLKVTNGIRSLIFDGDEIDGAGNGPILLNNNSTGGVYIGANGTGLKEIIKATVSIPSFTVIANGCSSRLISVANAAVDSAVSASPDNGIATGLIIAYAQVSSVGTVLIRVCNFTGSNIIQATSDFHVAVVR
jgi:hypothetical protein